MKKTKETEKEKKTKETEKTTSSSNSAPCTPDAATSKKSDKSDNGQKPAVKAKTKSNKVTEDYQERLERVEGLLARLVDVMEAPSDSEFVEDRDVNLVPNLDLLDGGISGVNDHDIDSSSLVTLAPNDASSGTPPAPISSSSVDKPAAEVEDVGFATRFAVPSAVGKPLDTKLAITLKYMMANQLEEKAMQKVSDTYQAPSNCERFVVPRVRPTIWDSLTPPTRSKDLKMQRVQKPLVKGIIAMAQSVDFAAITDQQQDAFALLCNANFELNALR